jgi:hypothetical protein
VDPRGPMWPLANEAHITLDGYNFDLELGLEHVATVVGNILTSRRG